MGNSNSSQSDEERKRYSDEWTMSQERTHMENLVCQRFNFLLAFVGLTFTAAVQVKSNINLLLLFLFGTIVTGSLFLTLYRAQWKLNYIMQHELKEHKDHPVIKVDEAANKNCCVGSVKDLIGSGLPAFFCLTFVIASVFVALRICHS